MEVSSWGNLSPVQVATFVSALVAGYFGQAWPMCWPHSLAGGGVRGGHAAKGFLSSCSSLSHFHPTETRHAVNRTHQFPISGRGYGLTLITTHTIQVLQLSILGCVYRWTEIFSFLFCSSSPVILSVTCRFSSVHCFAGILNS